MSTSDNFLRMFTGDKIRCLREQKGLSYGQFKQITGLDKSYIARVEKGLINPTIRTLEKIAKGLQITVQDLIEEKTPEEVHVSGKDATGSGGRETGPPVSFCKLREIISKREEEEPILNIWHQLAEAERQAVLKYARFELAEQTKVEPPIQHYGGEGI